MIFSKKSAAKPGSNAAILIFIIGLSIIVYSILSDSIDLNNSNDSNNVNDRIRSTYLLRENVGHLTEGNKEKESYQLPSVSLYTSLKSNLFLSSPYVGVKTNLFGDETKELAFDVENINVIKNALLSFNGEKFQEGKNLIVSLNGVEVYHADVKNNNVIDIDKKLIKPGTNTLLFSAESSIFTNDIVLSEIKFVSDLYDLSKNKARVDLTIFEEDFKDFESAEMSFYVDCFEPEVGRLSITINGNRIYNSLPDCNIFNQNIQVPLSSLRTGNNVINFENEFGSYVLDDVRIDADYIKPREPIYYFAVSEETLKNNTFYLNFKFVDRSNKDGLIYVNKHPLVLNTNALNFTYNITNFVEDGFNSVKLIPTELVDIAEMNVEIKETD